MKQDLFKMLNKWLLVVLALQMQYVRAVTQVYKDCLLLRAAHLLQ